MLLVIFGRSGGRGRGGSCQCIIIPRKHGPPCEAVNKRTHQQPCHLLASPLSLLSLLSLLR